MGRSESRGDHTTHGRQLVRTRIREEPGGGAIREESECVLGMRVGGGELKKRNIII